MLTIRGNDAHGSGEYYAPRAGGRKHNGVDLVYRAGGEVRALTPGIVTKIGLPYSPNNTVRDQLRYVQVSDANDIRVRYFYVKPCVVVGQLIGTGELIGTCADLTKVYNGITNHVHFETLLMVKGQKVFVNPIDYLQAHHYVFS